MKRGGYSRHRFSCVFQHVGRLWYPLRQSHQRNFLTKLVTYCFQLRLFFSYFFFIYVYIFGFSVQGGSSQDVPVALQCLEEMLKKRRKQLYLVVFIRTLHTNVCAVVCLRSKAN